MTSNFFWSAAALAISTTAALAGPTQWPDSTFDPNGWDSPSTMDQSPGVWNNKRQRYDVNDLMDARPAEICLAPDSNPTPELLQKIADMYRMGYGSRYNIGASWTGSAGSPVTLTWSFVPDGTVIPADSFTGDQPSTLFASMDANFASRGGRAVWMALFDNAFTRWSQLTGITYIHVKDGAADWDDGAAWGTAGNDSTRGDIRISMKPLDGLSNVLAYNTFPTDSDMVMDSQDGSNWISSTNNYRFLRDVVMHEHGHGLGFAHVCPANGTKLMEPFINTGFDGPQQDDIRAGQENYGDINEPNNFFAQSFDLGAINGGSTLTIGTIPNNPSPTPVAVPSNSSTLSIDRTGEEDWYKFQLTQPRLVNFTLTPIGSNYADYDQNANGSCQTGANNMNALAIADLRFFVYQSNGTTMVRDQNLVAAGSAETLTGLLCGPAGDVVVRIAANGAVTSTQLYRFSITVQNTNITPSATQGSSSAFTRITWPTIPNTSTYQIRRNTVDVQPTSAGSVIATGLSNATTSFDDTTGTPGVTYYYWVLANSFVTGSSGSTAVFRYTSTNGASGFRALPPNNPPTANAGPDQVVTDADRSGSESVTLDGSLSSDTDGTITNYTWKEGVTTLASSATPTSVVSLPTGTHTITLTVTDNGTATASDTVSIKVNNPPTANPGSNQSVSDADLSGSEIVALNGSASTDTDGGITAYEWKEGVTTLATTANANVNFIVGVHNLTLTVTDTNGATDTKPVTITVTQPNNTLPIANAGPDQTVTDSDNSGDELVALNGSASNDPDGSITNYEWKEGASTLATGASATPSVLFTVGVHTVTLTVTDNRGAVATDDVVITVEAPAGCPCVADFDQSGGTPDAGDIDAFFLQWLAGDPSADSDCSGGTPDASDIDVFFAEWLAGGC